MIKGIRRRKSWEPFATKKGRLGAFNKKQVP